MLPDTRVKPSPHAAMPATAPGGMASLPPLRDVQAAVLDPARLAALRATGLLDGATEEALDRLTRLAARLLHVPVALVSLVDDKRQVFASQVGLEGELAATRQTPIEQSFCKNVVTTHQPLLISDARVHAGLARNPVVEDGSVVAYAGVPLVDSGQHALGALCVVDGSPRTWSDEDLNTLRDLAQLVMTEIELRGTARALRESEARYRRLFEGMGVGVFVVNPQREAVWTNPALQRLLGYSERELLGVRMGALSHPDDIAAERREGGALSVGSAHERRARHKDGHWLWIRLTLSALHPENPGSGWMVGVLEDISAAHAAAEEAAQQSAHVRLLQQVAILANEATSSRDAMQATLELVCRQAGFDLGHAVLFDGEHESVPSGHLWYSSDPDGFAGFRASTERKPLPAAPTLPPASQPAARHHSILPLPPDADEDHPRGGFSFPVRVGSEVVAALELFSTSGQEPSDALLEVLRNVGVQLGRVVERERNTAAVEALSLTDELTGLTNRRGLILLGDRELELLRRKHRPALLFFADVDGLKDINDRLGHEQGDRAIEGCAEVLRRCFRSTDIIARLGGDEFVVLAVEMPEEQGPALLERIEQATMEASAAGSGELVLSMSAGFTFADPAQGLTIEGLLGRADAIMYEKKRARRARRTSAARALGVQSDAAPSVAAISDAPRSRFYR